MAPPEWFRKKIAEGCLRMATAGLKYAPVDTLPETESVWADALWGNGSRFQHKPETLTRIRQTFDRLTAECREWPQPADFLELYEEREIRDSAAKPLALPAPPADPVATAKAKARFFEQMREIGQESNRERNMNAISAALKGLRNASTGSAEPDASAGVATADGTAPAPVDPAETEV